LRQYVDYILPSGVSYSSNTVARKVSDIFVNLNFIDRIAVKFLNTKYHKISPLRKELFHAEGLTNKGQL